MNDNSLDDVLCEHLIIEFLSHGTRAVAFLRTAESLLKKSAEEFSRLPELIAYSLREAMKEIPASQESGSPGQWKTVSRKVSEAKKKFELVRDLPGGDQDDALHGLLSSIDEMEVFHQQARIHQKRLLAVIVNRTGSRLTGDRLSPVHKYQSILDRLDSSLHNSATMSEVENLWNETLSVLRQLFLPPAMRHAELDALAAIENPEASDVAGLLANIVSDQHMMHFLSKLSSPRWIEILQGSEILDPPKGQAPWPFFSAIDSLKSEYPEDLANTLTSMYSRCRHDPQQAWYLARGAFVLGTHGRAILLEALRDHRTSEGIQFFATRVAEGSDPTDDYLQKVAEIALDPSSWLRHPSLHSDFLAAFASGISEGNHVERVTLICYKINKFVKVIPGEYSVRIPQDALHSLSGDEENHIELLLIALRDSLTKVLLFTQTGQVLELISTLTEVVRIKVRAWILSNATAVESSQLVEEIATAIRTREPIIDDIPLVERALLECDKSQCHGTWENEFIDPPNAAQIGEALSSRSMPEEWMRLFLWKGLLPAEFAREWETATTLMSTVFGQPGKERLERPNFTVRAEFSSTPIPHSELSSMTVDAAARKIAEWRPSPNQWGFSVRELARTLELMVKQNSDRWAQSPIATAAALRHPTYIAHYLTGLATAESLENLPVSEVVDLIMFVRTHPWDVVPLGQDSFEFDKDWRGTEHAIIELIKRMARSDVGFAEKDDLIWEILETEARDFTETSGVSGTDFDPIETGLSRPSVSAYDAVLAFAGFEYRKNSIVRPEVFTLLDTALDLTERTGAEHRGVIATRIAFLRHVNSSWIDDRKDKIFGESAPPELAAITIDMALKWGQPNRWILENFPKQVQDAVKRGTTNAIDHYLVAALWKVNGYAADRIVSFLVKVGKLSDAGERMGQLLKGEDVEPDIVEVGILFWKLSLEHSSDSSLSGFGWFAEVGCIPFEVWLDLMTKTVVAMRGRVDWAHKVGKRINSEEITQNSLIIINELIRGLADEWDRRSLGEMGVSAIKKSQGLDDSAEYKRLHTTLLERGFDL